jgi:hypothetical protein
MLIIGKHTFDILAEAIQSIIELSRFNRKLLASYTGYGLIGSYWLPIKLA